MGNPNPAVRTGSVLVTGAAGFIGSHLVAELLAAGHTVTGLDRRTPDTHLTAELGLAAVRSDPRFRFLDRDIVTGDLTEAVAGCDTVYHLAAIPGVRASWGERFAEYVAVNITGTARLIEACVAAGVRRLVVASSSSVYGSVTRPSRETDVTRPISPYGVSKLAAEQLSLANAGRGGLSVCALRYFTVYGPRQRPDMAIGRVLMAALDGLPMTLYGDGGHRREFTYVGDVVTATMAAGRSADPPPIVNVGGGVGATMTDVLRTAEKVTGRVVPVIAGDEQAGDVRVTGADHAVARQALGYRARISLEDGMARHAEWLESLGPRIRADWRTPREPACVS